MKLSFAAGPEPRFARIITALFAITSAISLAHHEMWRDELQAWSLARWSASIPDLLANLRYEGHPPVWYFLLRVASWFSKRPEAMQVVNWLVCTAWVWCFSAFAPFPRWVRAMFPFGYMVLYMYGTISRSYAVGLCALTFACAFARDRERSPIRLAVVLLIAGLTSVHALVLMSAFVFALAVDAAPAAFASRRIPRWLVWCAGAFAVVVVYWLVALIPPPADYGPGRIQNALALDGSRLSRLAMIFTAVLIPWPRANGIQLLGAHYFSTLAPSLVGTFAILILFALVVVLRRSRRALVFFASGLLMLAVIFYAVHEGYSRHHGFLLLTVLFGLWLARPDVPAREGRWVDGAAAVVCAAQIPMGVLAFKADYEYPFSHARNVADWVRTHAPADAFIVAHADHVGAAVGAYLDREVYFVRGDRAGHFIRWDRARERVPTRSVCALAVKRAHEAARPLVLVTNYRLLDDLKACGLHEAIEFHGALQGDESYCVYQP